MKKKMIFYTIIMAIFMVLSYLFIVSGFSMKTKEYTRYQQKSDFSYLVNLLPNTVYDREYLGMGGSYVGSLVKDISLDVNYNIRYDKDIVGYYIYEIDEKLIALDDGVVLWEKDAKMLSSPVEVINQNDVKEIGIKDNIIIDYQRKKTEIDNFNEEYNMQVSGELIVSFKLKTTLDFETFKDTYDDVKEVKLIIPITDSVFNINLVNDNQEIDSYSELTTKEGINYLFLIFGALCLSFGVAFLVVIIRELFRVSDRENKYILELKKIFKEHDDEIVVVKEFKSGKKYNLIYVDSFKELVDVYDKVNSPISFKELKKNQKAVFLIIENDNAWIYMLSVKNDDRKEGFTEIM